MPSPSLADTSEAAIFSRVMEPEKHSLTADAAASLLEMDFHPDDRERMNSLSEKASKGILTLAEDQELENYIHVNHLLTIIHSKARRSLRKSVHPAL